MSLIPAIPLGREVVVVIGRWGDDFYLVILVLFSFLIVLSMIHSSFTVFIFFFRNNEENK